MQQALARLAHQAKRRHRFIVMAQAERHPVRQKRSLEDKNNATILVVFLLENFYGKLSHAIA